MDIERLTELKQQVFDDFQLYEVKMQNSFEESMKEVIPTGEMDDDGKELTALIDESIARQSVKSEELAEAVAQLQSEYVDYLDGCPASCEKWNRNIDLTIAALQEYQPWVSVSERLPNDWVPVLVTYIGFNDGKLHSDGVARWFVEENGYNGGWLWELDGSDVAVEITH